MLINLKIILLIFNISRKEFAGKIGVHPNNIDYLGQAKNKDKHSHKELKYKVKKEVSKLTRLPVKVIDKYMDLPGEELKKRFLQFIKDSVTGED